MKTKLQETIEIAIKLSEMSIGELENLYEFAEDLKIKKIIKDIIVYKADRI